MLRASYGAIVAPTWHLSVTESAALPPLLEHGYGANLPALIIDNVDPALWVVLWLIE